MTYFDQNRGIIRKGKALFRGVLGVEVEMAKIGLRHMRVSLEAKVVKFY